MTTRLTCFLAVLLLLGALGPTPMQAQENRVVLVVGLGGDAEYRETFHGLAMDLKGALEAQGLPGRNIVYLGERPQDYPDLIKARSTKEDLGRVLAELASSAGPDDRILTILIGHGSSQGGEARFNLPGPDLTPQEFAVMLDGLAPRTVGVVNTTPASGPFLEALSGPNRVVLTATRSAQERNETQFGGFFAQALTAGNSDLDKDGRISLLEAFQFAQAEVARYYEERNLLATEHSVLDDDGDGEGSSEPGPYGPDGILAGTFWLGSTPSASASALAAPADVSDPELRRLMEEKAELERRIAELRGLKAQMEETRYEAELEELLVALALKNREIREKGGGE